MTKLQLRELGAMSPVRLQVLDAVMRLGSCTFRRVVEHVPITLRAVYLHLLALKAAGLVSWEEGKSATIHATCRFIPAEELAPKETAHVEP